MKRNDCITRILVLPADPMTVWNKSFATPEALSSWFPDSVEGDFVIGESFFLIWGKQRCEARLTRFEPGKALAYQWHPGIDCELQAFPLEELTTVTFILTAHPEGTEVTLTEAGFENIPANRRGTSMGENSSGWDSELPKLAQQYGC